MVHVHVHVYESERAPTYNQTEFLHCKTGFASAQFQDPKKGPWSGKHSVKSGISTPIAVQCSSTFFSTDVLISFVVYATISCICWTAKSTGLGEAMFLFQGQKKKSSMCLSIIMFRRLITALPKKFILILEYRYTFFLQSYSTVTATSTTVAHGIHSGVRCRRVWSNGMTAG